MEPFQDACYPFDRAGLYEIHVVGDVDVSMLEYLAGMTSKRQVHAEHETTLIETYSYER